MSFFTICAMCDSDKRSVINERGCGSELEQEHRSEVLANNVVLRLRDKV
jgi:hypothetical protein